MDKHGNETDDKMLSQDVTRCVYGSGNETRKHQVFIELGITHL